MALLLALVAQIPLAQTAVARGPRGMRVGRAIIRLRGSVLAGRVRHDPQLGRAQGAGVWHQVVQFDPYVPSDVFNARRRRARSTSPTAEDSTTFRSQPASGTRNLFDPDAFRQMKPTGNLILTRAKVHRRRGGARAPARRNASLPARARRHCRQSAGRLAAARPRRGDPHPHTTSIRKIASGAADQSAEESSGFLTTPARNPVSIPSRAADRVRTQMKAMVPRAPPWETGAARWRVRRAAPAGCWCA